MSTVAAVMTHPDDIEFTCAGTLALLHRAGWKVRLATLSPGDVTWRQPIPTCRLSFPKLVCSRDGDSFRSWMLEKTFEWTFLAIPLDLSSR